MNSSVYHGRTALVLGGAQRIGNHIAAYLHRNGANIIVQYRNSHPQASEFIASCNKLRPDSARMVYADFSADPHTQTYEDMPPADIIIYAASAFSHDGAGQFSPSASEHLYRVNVTAPLALADHYICRKADDSRIDIMFLSDYIAYITPEAFLSYGMTRAALHYGAKTLARQTAAKNTRVNVLALGYVMPAPTQRQAHFDALCAATPLSVATPLSDITAATDMLLQSETITGDIIRLDSGAALRHAPYADAGI